MDVRDVWLWSFHWLWFLAMIAVVIYPAGRVLSRIGFSPLWSVVMFIPLINLVALWLLAFAEWPERPSR